MELASERCIVSLLDWFVEVNPTYILLFSEIQSPKGRLNQYITPIYVIRYVTLRSTDQFCRINNFGNFLVNKM